MKIQSIGRNSINQQQRFTGLVKFTDISGEQLVIDAKKIAGAYEAPLKIEFNGIGCFNSRDTYAARFDGIHVAYESPFSPEFIASLPDKQRNFLKTKTVKLAASLEKFSEFWEKALASKKTMSLGEEVQDNSFIQKIRKAEPGEFIDIDTSAYNALNQIPGFRDVL